MDSKYSDADDDILMIDSMRRLVTLEQTEKKLEDQMSIRNLRWKSQIEEAKRDSEMIHRDIEDVRTDFKVTITEFMQFIDEFKTAATSEDWESVKSDIESWNPEKIISMDEFKRIATKIIKAQLRIE